MCFGPAFFESILIWLVVIGAIFAIVNILLPMVLSQIGAPAGAVMQILRIALWAFICIAVIIFAFDVIGCLLHVGSFPRIG